MSEDKVTWQEINKDDADDMNSTAASKPTRYQGENGIECIDVIKQSVGRDSFVQYCLGQVIRYLFRYRRKNGVNDLEKSLDYLNWALLEANARNVDFCEENDLTPAFEKFSCKWNDEMLAGVEAALGKDRFLDFLVGSALLLVELAADAYVGTPYLGEAIPFMHKADNMIKRAVNAMVA